MAQRARCSVCDGIAPFRRFITRQRKVIVVVYCPRCDAAPSEKPGATR